MRAPSRPLPRSALVLGLVLVAAGCSAPADPVLLELRPLNGSGVQGTVTLAPAAEARTRVEVSVVGSTTYDDMPAHIHPGTCDELVPQPKYPLENVVDGRSVTEVVASLDELLGDTLALNLHASNEQMDLYTACVELP